MLLEEIEAALAEGRLSYHAPPVTKSPWSVRRNGRTKRWKTRPNEFRIPVKIGFYNYHAITHENCNSSCWRIEE